MSEPKRYTLEMVSSEAGHIHWMHDNEEGLSAPLGDFVRWEDYARLKAEVERYKFTLEEERQIARQDWAGLRCEHDRVKRALEQAEAEVERIEPELEQRCRELNLSLGQQAVQLRQIGDLKAEVERLRKAGDAMALCITEFRCGKYGNALDKVGGFYVWQDWLAAKEGKPHA